MKTLDQIARYVSQCRFSDGDWEELLAWARARIKGGRLHRAASPVSDSTFAQFLDWYESGLGAGDVARYGRTLGIVSSRTPSGASLAAYLDYEGRLVVRDMEVMEPWRLAPAPESDAASFRGEMAAAGYSFSPRLGAASKSYEPEKGVCVAFRDAGGGGRCVGVFAERDGDRARFSGLLGPGGFSPGCWVALGLAPLSKAAASDARRLRAAAAKAGWTLDPATGEFAKAPARSEGSRYWYLTDRFTVAADLDNGAPRHSARFEAGNYFPAQEEALVFMRLVVEIRKGRL